MNASVDLMVPHPARIVAVHGEAGQEQLRLRDAKGIEHEIALADVTDARLAFRWKP